MKDIARGRAALFRALFKKDYFLPNADALGWGGVAFSRLFGMQKSCKDAPSSAPCVSMGVNNMVDLSSPVSGDPDSMVIYTNP